MRKFLSVIVFAFALLCAVVALKRSHLSRAAAADTVRALCEVPRALCGNRALPGALGSRTRAAHDLRRELER